METIRKIPTKRRRSDLRKNYGLYLLALPAILCALVFSYLPMLGIIIAFQRYDPFRGLWGSAFVGLDNFRFFFSGSEWLQVTLKEAGNLLSGFYAAAGKPFNQQDKQLFGNPFAQFVKATFEVHKTFSLTPGVKVATRFYSGVILSYGNSLRAPYTEQFYVGGANSIRGFAVRSVGPGRYQSPLSSAYAYTDQTGDFKLEANAELRFHLFGDLHGATFLDAGNVWLTRRDAQRPNAEISLKNLKDIAVGTGVGLRYDLDFLVIRFDVGVALHAPYDTGKSGWYNMPRFKDSLAYHLAIGYPF